MSLEARPPVPICAAQGPAGSYCGSPAEWNDKKSEYKKNCTSHLQLNSLKSRKSQAKNKNIGSWTPTDESHLKAIRSQCTSLFVGHNHPAVNANNPTSSNTPVTLTTEMVHEKKLEVKMMEDYTQSHTREAKTVETNRVVVDNATGATVEDRTIREEIKTETLMERVRKQYSVTFTEFKSIRNTLVQTTIDVKIPPRFNILLNDGSNHQFQQDIIDHAIGDGCDFNLPFQAMSKEEFATNFANDVASGDDEYCYRINAMHWSIQEVSPFMPLTEVAELVNHVASLWDPSCKLAWCEEFRWVALVARSVWHIQKMSKAFYVRKEILEEEHGQIGTLLGEYRVADLGKNCKERQDMIVGITSKGHIKMTPKKQVEVQLFRVDANNKMVGQVFEVRPAIPLTTVFLTRDMAKLYGKEKENTMEKLFLTSEKGLKQVIGIPDANIDVVVRSSGKRLMGTEEQQLRQKIKLLNGAMAHMEMLADNAKLPNPSSVTGKNDEELLKNIIGKFTFEPFENMLYTDFSPIENVRESGFICRYLKHLDEKGMVDMDHHNNTFRRDRGPLGQPANESDIKTLKQVEAAKQDEKQKKKKEEIERQERIADSINKMKKMDEEAKEKKEATERANRIADSIKKMKALEASEATLKKKKTMNVDEKSALPKRKIYTAARKLPKNEKKKSDNQATKAAQEKMEEHDQKVAASVRKIAEAAEEQKKKENNNQKEGEDTERVNTPKENRQLLACQKVSNLHGFGFAFPENMDPKKADVMIFNEMCRRNPDFKKHAKKRQ
jgi:hypothetical protein